MRNDRTPLCQGLAPDRRGKSSNHERPEVILNVWEQSSSAVAAIIARLAAFDP